MGREVRRVPPDWQHPKDENGEFIPLFEYGSEPNPFEHMPEWPEGERTHWMMYEDTTEGTPISPAFETPEELARWLADTGASAFADYTATYEQWLGAIIRGSTPSAVIISGTGLISGVAGMAELTKDTEKQ